MGTEIDEFTHDGSFRNSFRSRVARFVDFIRRSVAAAHHPPSDCLPLKLEEHTRFRPSVEREEKYLLNKAHLGVFAALDCVDEVGPERLHLMQTYSGHHVLAHHDRNRKLLRILYSRHAKKPKYKLVCTIFQLFLLPEESSWRRVSVASKARVRLPEQNCKYGSGACT
jgi:hypothetical protein